MEIITIFILTLLVFITRIVNLLNIPIFTDEAIYIRWAQIGLADPAHRYISLTDGKQPLLTWLMYPLMKLFSDPLMAGRIVSVFSGVLASIGIYFLARELFNKKIAVVSVLVYIFSPFALIYDRLALMDSLLAMFGIWCMYLQILLAKRQELDKALILSFILGLALLTKSSAFFYIYLMPVSLLFFKPNSENKLKKFIKWLFYSVISVSIAEIIYNSLRLSPWFYIIKLKNYSFILTINEFIKSPFRIFLPNLNGLLQIFVGYISIPFSIILFYMFCFAVYKKDKKLLYLYSWFIFPFLALAFFGKVIFPRFILFMIMPLFIVISNFLTVLIGYIEKKKQLIIILLLLIIYPLFQSYLIIFSPLNVSIPVIDRNQLFDNWPAGYGVKEVVRYLTEVSQKDKVVIGTEGTFGLFPASIEMYLGNNKNVKIYGFWPVSEVPIILLESARTVPTYLVFKEKQDIPKEWPLTLIKEYKRGKGDSFLRFYQVDLNKIKT